MIGENKNRRWLGLKTYFSDRKFLIGQKQLIMNAV